MARALSGVICPEASELVMSSGSLSSRSAFATVERFFADARCGLFLAQVPSVMRLWYARASSTGLRFSRCMFSMSADFELPLVREFLDDNGNFRESCEAGRSGTPFSRDDRVRAVSAFLDDDRWMIPCSRIESASSLSAFSSNS
jgi:hypothetical protein